MACRWWWCTCKYDEFNAMHTAIQPPLYSSFVLLRYLFFSSLLLFVSSVLFICFIIWIPFCPMILTCVRSIKVKSLHSLFSCYYSTQHVCEWHQFFSTTIDTQTSIFVALYQLMTRSADIFYWICAIGRSSFWSFRLTHVYALFH